MAEQRTDHSEGNHAHDDEWLRITLEWDREQDVDHEQCHSKAGHDSGSRRRLFSRFPAIAILQIREPIGELGEPGLELVQDDDRCRVDAIDVCGDRDDSLPIRSLDIREASGDLSCRDSREGNLYTVPRADAHVFERA